MASIYTILNDLHYAQIQVSFFLTTVLSSSLYY